MAITSETPPLTDDELIEKYVAPGFRRTGIAEAVVEPEGIPVWALAGALMLREGATPEQVARDYEISLQAMYAALAYYQRHRAVIDDRIEANRVELW